MNLNLIIDPTGWLEATWSTVITLPQEEISAGIADSALRTQKTQVKCVSYHPTQIDMLRSDAAELGTDLAEYESLLSDWVAAYVPPPPEPVQVPQVITIRQAKLALLAAGLLDDVDDAVAASDRATQIEWEYATDVQRNWPTIAAVASVAGLTDEQVDGLFIAAAAL